MLRPAGFSSGRGDCARGGMFCGAVRFCRNVFRPVHAGHAFLLGCFSFVLCRSYVPIGMSCVRSRLLFAACAPNRTACGMFRSCSAVGRDRHSCVLGCRAVIELGWFTSGLRVSLWRSRQRTKETERTRGTRERSRRRGRVRFCVTISALRRFPRGVRWGYAPQTAPKSLRLSGLSSFDSRRGCVSRGEGHSGTTEL